MLGKKNKTLFLYCLGEKKAIHKGKKRSLHRPEAKEGLSHGFVLIRGVDRKGTSGDSRLKEGDVEIKN